MSDTPRTDSQPHITPSDLEDAWKHNAPLVDADFARIQADHKCKLREEFEALLGTSDVATGVERIKEAKRGAARYEVVRKMNATDFALLHQRCIHMDLRFDDEVDKLSERRKIRMHLNAKKEEKP